MIVRKRSPPPPSYQDGDRDIERGRWEDITVGYGRLLYNNNCCWQMRLLRWANSQSSQQLEDFPFQPTTTAAAVVAAPPLILNRVTEEGGSQFHAAPKKPHK